MSEATTLKNPVIVEGSNKIYNSQMRAAKYAAIFYLGLAVFGGFSILYLDSLIDWENSSKTIENLNDNENMVKVSIVLGLIGQISFLFLGIAFYYLFKPFDEKYSLTLLVLVVASVPIAMFNAVTSYAAIHIISNPSYLETWIPDQRTSWVMLFLKLNETGIYIAGFFWGLWLFPLGYMAYRSGYFPKLIGIFLMLGSIAYVLDSAAYFISEDIEKITDVITTIFSGIGEFSMLFWLIFKGANIDNNSK